MLSRMIPKLFAQMEQRKDFFTHLAATKDPLQPLGLDEWSVAQVIEHLVTLERGIVLSLKRAKDPLPPRTEEELTQLRSYVDLLEGAQRYEVPDGVTLPNPEPDLPKLLQDWQTARQRLQSMIDENQLPAPEIMAINHPIAGPLNSEETFQFMASHLVYHQKRVEQCLALLPNR